MMSNIRYRLIQIVEILLWLGALAGLARIALHAWQVRDAGVMAMLELAGPPLLALGGAMAGLIVLIGVYHNTRRNTEAVERLAKQGAGSLRRLPGAARPESAAVPPATSRRMSFAAPEPEPQPPAAPVPVMVAPPPQP
ncbi:MAG: hypothetical protein Q4G26_07205, partial [Paracoccus sp. (in: a-proteobacteria)]|nr:hypothetical protein [Paracoccus sp. (in: a-proteobacteria)]